MFLGVDLGTSSVKVALVDADGVRHAIADAAYEVRHDGDHAEIAPDRWLDATRSALLRMPEEHRARIEAVGLSGQMHGVVLIDDEARPVRDAVLWPDRRARSQLAAFAAFEAESPGVLANPHVPGMPGPVLRWLREHEPEVLAQAQRMVAPKDWVRAQLTGRTDVVSEPSDASASLLYDAATDGWSTALMEALDLPTRLLPPLVPSTEPCGAVRPAMAATLGIPEGIPVAAGAGDAAAALLGAGIEQPGGMLINVGTAAQALSVVPFPDATAAQLGLHHYRTAMKDHGWYAMAPVLNAGLALSWVRDVLGLEWPDVYRHAPAALSRVGEDPVFIPFLAGERDPAVGITGRGGWVGVATHHDSAALTRAALLGVAGYLVRRADHLRVGRGGRVTLTGGSMRNREWAQLLTDLLGAETDVSSTADVSVHGAVRLAAAAIGGSVPPVSHEQRLRPDPARAQQVVRASRQLDLVLERFVLQDEQLG